MSVVLYRSPRAAMLATMAALAAQTVPPDSVLVHVNEADAADLDDLRSDIAQALGHVSFAVEASSENLGFTGGHNRLLAQLFAAGCSAAVVLNPDLVLDPAALQALDAAASDLGGCVLLGPILELADPVTREGTGRIDTVGIRWTAGARHLDDRQGELLRDLPSAVSNVAGISGACLYVGRAAYHRVVDASGEFFDADFIAYREDAELAHRAHLLGISSYLVPAARGRHIRRLRGTARGVDPQIDALGVRNRFLIAFKYGARRPGSSVAALARDVVVVAGVLVRERSSLPALREAWRLRGRMRDKGRQVRAFAATRQ